MSGAELVAVLSVGASVIAVVDACNKLINRIKEFRGNAAFVSLRSRLLLFSSNIKSLDKRANTGVAFNEEEELLRDVLQGCKDTIEELDSLVTSLLPDPNASALKKTRHAVRAFLKDHRVRTVIEELQEYQNTILFHLSSKAEQNTRKAVFPLEEHKMALQMQQISTSGDALLSRPTQDSSSILYHRPQHVAGCALNDCSCFCHRLPHADGFTGYSAGISTCRCQGVQYLLRTAILRKLFQVSLAASWSNGLSVSCSVKFRNVVRSDNPGFELIRKCVWRNEITFEEAQAGLRALRDSSIIDFNDTTQYGYGYLEELCAGRLGKKHSVNLARFLAQEGVYWKRQTPISVGRDAIWPMSGEPNLDMMRALPPIDEFCLWWNNKRSYAGPDPFSMKAFTQICLAQIDIGQYRPLHAAVASNSVDEVKKLIKAQRTQDLTRNYLSQTVLHLAIQWPCILQILLENGYEDAMDSTDELGIPPLFYALCYGCTQSIDILVGAGASLPGITAPSATEVCWAHAAAERNEEPFVRLMEHYVRGVGPTRVHRDVLEPLIFMRAESGPWNLKTARHLVAEIEKWSESYPYDFRRRGETPLHVAMTPEHARVLMSYDGFDINSSSDEHGETPLMVYSWFLDPQLIQETLARGARVNATDRWGRNVLHYTFSRTFSLEPHRPVYFHEKKLNAVIEVATVLAATGGDIFQRDRCRCYCSPHGCSPLRAFVPARSVRGDHHMVYVWILELFVALKSCGKSGIIDLLIGEFGRLQRADEIGITHTCCSSKFSRIFGGAQPSTFIPSSYELEGWGNDWEEIREEESDLGSQLDQCCLKDSATDAGSWESRLVSILARRCVMMDAIDQRRLRRTGNDTEVEKRRLSLESCVERYTISMEGADNYLKGVLPKYDHGYWTKERERVSQLLLEEIHLMRGATGMEQDWDIENWVDGDALFGFRVGHDVGRIWSTFMPTERI